ncbi:hypothetical protein [Tardiphaga sp. 11_C7_N12_6]
MIRTRVRAESISREAIDVLRRLIIDNGGIIDFIVEVEQPDKNYLCIMFVDASETAMTQIQGSAILLGCTAFKPRD